MLQCAVYITCRKAVSVQDINNPEQVVRIAARLPGIDLKRCCGGEDRTR